MILKIIFITFMVILSFLGVYNTLDMFGFIEKIKTKFYKNHIRYTTDKYSFYKFPKDEDPFWYFKEIVRSDGYVIQRTQIGKFIMVQIFVLKIIVGVQLVVNLVKHQKLKRYIKST